MARAVRVSATLVLLTAALAALPAVTSQQDVSAALLETVTDCSNDDEFDTALTNVDEGGAIEFDCGVDTITFDGEKTIDKALTIDGGSQITLSGGDTTRLFSVSGDGDLTLENITLEDGEEAVDFGGAIDNSGTLTITNSTVSGNSAGLDGGAIYSNGGILTITSSTFSDNSAGFGGGAIFYDNSVNFPSDSIRLTVTNSTFSGNVADDSGGAIYNGSYGIATITNATFSGNSADFAGAIDTSGTLAVTASILVDNGVNCDEDPNSRGYNLTDDASCGFDSESHIQGDADLGELADNGGPTETMLPGPDSDAIDAIPAQFCSEQLPATDQRGVSRHQGFGCDIGAVEVEADFVAVETALCANRYNGDLRLPRTETCASTEVAFQLPDDRTLTTCVNRYNGDMRYSRTGACASTETAMPLAGDGSRAVCVNRYNGDVRVPRVAGQCPSTETARMI